MRTRAKLALAFVLLLVAAVPAFAATTPTGKTADQIVDEIMANLVPGAIAIPAAVFELVRLQEKGYKLVVNH